MKEEGKSYYEAPAITVVKVKIGHTCNLPWEVTRRLCISGT